MSDGSETASDCLTVTILSSAEPPPEQPAVETRITIVGPIRMIVPLDSSFSDTGATCKWFPDGATLPVTARGAVDTSTAGTYHICYYCGHSTSERQVPVSASNEPPEIHLVQHRTSIPAGSTANYGSDAVCFDYEDGDISNLVSSSISFSGDGTATITYSCTDSGGSTDTTSQGVRVLSDNPPRLVMFGSDTVRITAGSTFSDPGTTCTDTKDGTLSVTVDGSVDTSTRAPARYGTTASTRQTTTHMTTGRYT